MASKSNHRQVKFETSASPDQNRQKRDERQDRRQNNKNDYRGQNDRGSRQQDHRSGQRRERDPRQIVDSHKQIGAHEGLFNDSQIKDKNRGQNRENQDPNRVRRDHRDGSERRSRPNDMQGRDNSCNSNNTTRGRSRGAEGGKLLKEFKCNICYSQPGFFMNDCGCFYCLDCNLDSQGQQEQGNLCMACGNKKKVSFDIRDKKYLRSIESNLTNSEQLMKKVLEAIKFQDLHEQRYIKELENRGTKLLAENTSLKDQVAQYQEKSRKRRLEEEDRIQQQNSRNKSKKSFTNQDENTPNFQNGFGPDISEPSISVASADINQRIGYRRRGGPQDDQISEALSIITPEKNACGQLVDIRSVISGNETEKFAQNNFRNNPDPNAKYRQDVIQPIRPQRRTNELSTSSKQLTLQNSINKINSKMHARNLGIRPVVHQAHELTTVRSNSLQDVSTTNKTTSQNRKTPQKQFAEQQARRNRDRSMPVPDLQNQPGALRYNKRNENSQVHQQAESRHNYRQSAPQTSDHFKNQMGQRRTHQEYYNQGDQYQNSNQNMKRKRL